MSINWNNPEEVKVYNRARWKKWYEKNKEKVSARNRRDYWADPEKARARVRKYNEEHRAEIREKSKEYRNVKTGGAVSYLHHHLQRGKIKKQPCEICGSSIAEAHHDDYNKPLEVRWLCKKHHAEWHRHNTPKYVQEVV